MKSVSLRPFKDFKEYQAEYPLAHELPYWDFFEDLVVLADGSLALGMKLRGVAVETLDTERVNKLTLDFRAFLNSLPDGCEISIFSELTSEYENLLKEHLELKGNNPQVGWLTEARVSMLREDIRSRNILKPQLTLIIYRRFEKEKTSSLNIFSSPKRFVAVKKENHSRMERELRQTADALFSMLKSAGIAASPLNESAIWDFAYRFLNPSRCEGVPAPKRLETHRAQEFGPEELKKVPELSIPSPREQLVFSDVIQGYDAIFFDGFYHRCISLKTLPEFTHSALISKLMQLSFPHLLHVHVKVPEQSKELSSLQAKRRMAHSMSMSQGGRATDLESQAKLNSTEELLQELINTGQKIFYFQGTVLLRANTQDELDAQTRSVLSKVREMNGAEAMTETVGTFKVWKTLLPFGNTAMVRPKRIKTDNLADFLPLYQAYEGSDV